MKDHHKLIFKAIGNKILMSRLNKGLSLEEMANKSKISTAKISKIENGETDFKLYTLVQIDAVLEVEVNSLVVDNLK